MMEWLPRETIEPTKMILPIQRMTTREEVIEDQLQEIEDALAPGIEDQDLGVEEGDLILAKEGEAEVEIVGAVAVTEEAEAETGDEIEAVREEKERWLSLWLYHENGLHCRKEHHLDLHGGRGG